MKILFAGQRGLTVPDNRKAPREARVTVLANILVDRGHTVAVTCDRNFAARHLSNVSGVNLLHIPAIAGLMKGMALGEIYICWKEQPQIAHLHGWSLVRWMWLLARLCPSTKFIWTVDELPHRWTIKVVRIIKFAEKLVSNITVTNRELQWYLLNEAGVKAEYIPDGYTAHDLPLLKLRKWGLKAGQYGAACTDDTKERNRIRRSWKASGTRKQLVFLSGPHGLRADSQQGRTRESLLKQAGVVISGQKPIGLDILQAMDGQAAMVAITSPLAEELLGVSAQYVPANKPQELTDALKTVVKNKGKQEYWHKLAEKRARAYFTWEKVAAQYQRGYTNLQPQLVMVDSLRQPIQRVAEA